MTFQPSDAKKIRQTLKINKENNKTKKDKKQDLYITVNANDTLRVISATGDSILFTPDKISFAGYEKEINSSKESFLIINRSESTLSNINANIIYKDMKGRMLHKRELNLVCDIPPHESRKIDIPSWDSQHTYFYYRGNEPKKIATPYIVEFEAISYKIK